MREWLAIAALLFTAGCASPSAVTVPIKAWFDSAVNENWWERVGLGVALAALVGEKVRQKKNGNGVKA